MGVDEEGRGAGGKWNRFAMGEEQVLRLRS